MNTTTFLLSLFGIAGVLTAALAIERIAGAGRAKSAPFNAACGLFQLVFTQLSSAAIAPGALWISSKAGRPIIHLSGRGWMFPLSLVAILAFIDLIDYVFHRLEHRIPWLWAMHSLHHSDAAMNATTAYRHFWLDRALHAAAFIPLGLLVRSDTDVILGAIVAGWILAAFEHSSLRIGIPRAPWLIVTPQFHRVHHSIEQKHYDRNFAGILPLWDLLFGTYLKPEGFPDTGLTEGEPRDLKDALSWAFTRPRD